MKTFITLKTQNIWSLQGYFNVFKYCYIQINLMGKNIRED